MIDYYRIYEGLVSKHPRRNAGTLYQLADGVIGALTTNANVSTMTDGITMLCLLADNPSDVRTATVACRLAEELDAAINSKVLQVLQINDRTGVELYNEGEDCCEIFRVDD